METAGVCLGGEMVDMGFYQSGTLSVGESGVRTTVNTPRSNPVRLPCKQSLSSVMPLLSLPQVEQDGDED